MDSQSASRNGSSVGQTIGHLTPIDPTLQAQGLSPDQVRGAFAALAAELEPIYVEMAELIRENDQLRRQAMRTNATTPGEEDHDFAVALLTQAQDLADALISDASGQARDLVLAARAHHREMVKQASAVVVTPPPPASATVGSDEVDSDGTAVVQTLAKMAQTQFLAVLDALTEQVNRLGETAATSETPGEDGMPTREVSLPPPPTGRASRQASLRDRAFTAG